MKATFSSAAVERIAGIYEDEDARTVPSKPTSAVWTDRAAQQFLVETHSSQWSSNEDLAFLLSPRHFAAAIATGKVGDVEMWEVAGGLSLLGYFEWLAVLVRDTEHRPDLRDGIIGHARWSHSAGVLKSRFYQWAGYVAEWKESAPALVGTRRRERAGGG